MSLQTLAMSDTLCRCGSAKPFAQCCKPFLGKLATANTAEQLMRSRFTAFCLHKFKYLIDTLHPSKHQPNDLAELETSSHKTSWVKLTLQHTQQGLETDNQGSVEFSAIFNENRRFFELRETSSFIKENGQWFYLDGSPRVIAIDFKLKRNQPCWCFSGKKFKHCHALL
jgi:SEC-C motif-containing protein